MSDAQIVVHDLAVSATTPRGRTIKLVSNISFSVERGEVLALIGESGSGKTTIAMALMGYARHGCFISDGDIEICGESILGLSDRKLRQFRSHKIAYVAQSAAASFDPGMKIINQVVEAVVVNGITSRKAAVEKAISLFRELALPNPETIGNRYPHQVSGGQLQRLMAAMALVGDPEVVIFDEPTTALDVTTQVEVLKVFKRVVRERHMTAIYVSHDLAVVAQMADDILVLRNGLMEELGSAKQLIEAPQTAYAQELIAAAHQRPRDSSWNAENKSKKPLLEIRDLAVGYGARNREGVPKTKILQGINLKVWRRESIGIIGESGSGKTTLAQALVGLVPAYGGNILFAEHYLAYGLDKRLSEDKRRIQYVFQMADTALNPTQTIREILGRPLKFFFQLHGKALNERIDELLDLVKLPRNLLNRKPGALSGGQKQRVNLARALAGEPEIIICDEVTSALDTVVASTVLDLINHLRNELNLTVIFISHDMHAVRSVCDEIFVMNHGRMVIQLPREEFSKPSDEPYFEHLKNAVPELRLGWLDEHQDGTFN